LSSIGGEYARERLLDGAAPDGLLNRTQVEHWLSRKESAQRGSTIGALIMLQTWWNEFFRR
jgi:hypothetical protein